MRVRVLTGDLFDSNAQTLVNTVNCVGVMGKGIALEFKRRFPEMYLDYKARCDRGEVRLGRPYLFRGLLLPWILNFPTKDHWRSVASLDDIIAGLGHLLLHYKEWGITSLAVPPLGSGNGQLEWRVVGPTLTRYLSRMDIPVELYAPYGTPSEQLRPEFYEDGRSIDYLMPEPDWLPGHSIALAEMVARLDSDRRGLAVGSTMFQKLAFLATSVGIPTGIEFKRGSYGPYSADVKRLMARLIQNGVLTQRRSGSMLKLDPGETFEDAREAYAVVLDALDPQIDRVVDLMMRTQDTNDAELFASIIAVASDLTEQTGTSPTEQEIVNGVLNWKIRRRPPLDELELSVAVRDLYSLGWIAAKPSPELAIPAEL